MLTALRRVVYYSLNEETHGDALWEKSLRSLGEHAVVLCRKKKARRQAINMGDQCTHPMPNASANEPHYLDQQHHGPMSGPGYILVPQTRIGTHRQQPDGFATTSCGLSPRSILSCRLADPGMSEFGGGEKSNLAGSPAARTLHPITPARLGAWDRGGRPCLSGASGACMSDQGHGSAEGETGI